MAGKWMLRSLYLLLIVALPVGCEQQPTPTETGPPTEALPSPTATEEAADELAPFEENIDRWGIGNLGIAISADRRYVDAGEPVRIRFTVINRGDETEVIESEEGPIMDILVRHRSGSTDLTRDWWSEDRQITPEMRRLELGPGESKTIEMTWVPPDRIYNEPVDLFGILHDQHGKTDAWTYLCVEDGCAEY